jgi:hypothetical protein
MVKPWNKDRLLAEVRTGYEYCTQARVSRYSGKYTLNMVDDIYLDNPDRRFYEGASLDEIHAKMTADSTLPAGLSSLGNSALKQAQLEVLRERAGRRR